MPRHTFLSRAIGAAIGPSSSKFGVPTNGPSGPVPLTVTGNPPDARQGEAYSYQMTAEGGTAPYTWSTFAGALPTGLSMNSAGLITGTPTVVQTATFTIRATDNVAATNNVARDILVAANLVATGVPGAGNQGSSYSFTPGVSGGNGTLVWSIFAGSLPPGVSLNTATGALTGTLTTVGTYGFTLRVTDSASPTPDTSDIVASVVVSAIADLVASGSPPGANEGSAFSFTPSVAGGVGAKTWTLQAGSLPTGLSLNGSTGAITGTPSVPGSYSFTLRVTDSNTPTPDTDDLACSISVGAAGAALSMAGTPPQAVEGQAYNWQAVVTGGVPPYSLAVTTGALPAGLTIDADDCSINGTPTTVENQSFTLTVTDSVSDTDTLATSIDVEDDGAVDGADAVFKATGVPTGMSLSESNARVTKTSAIGAFIGLASYKNANRYWVEFEGVAGTGVEYGGIGVVNTLYDGSSQPGTGANATRGTQLYEDSVRGTWIEYYNNSYGASHVLGGGGAMDTGGIVGAEYDNVARKFFPFINPAGGSFQWIAGNPNTNPELGVPYGATGDVAPCVGGYYSDSSFRIRTSAACTEQANRRSGTIVGWKDSSAANDPLLNISGNAADGVDGDAYTFTPTVGGGTAPYAFAISAGALPAGVSLNASTGALTGTPTVSGQYSFTIRVTDGVDDTDDLVVYMAVAAEYVPPEGDFLFNQTKAVHTPSYGTVPAKGVERTDPTTGLNVKRMTNSATDSPYTSGSLCVYSRFPPISSDGLYLVVHGENSTSAWVIRRSDGVVVNNNLQHAGGVTLGENNELRWDYTGANPTRMYYVHNKLFCQIDVLTGINSVIRDFSADFPTADYICNDVEGDSSNDSDYWCWMAMVRASSGPYYPVAIFSYRKSTNAILGTITSATSGIVLGSDSGAAGGGRMTRPNMVEAAPDGSGIVIHWARSYVGLNNNLTGTHQDGPHFYPNAITIGSALKVAVDATHSGWGRIGSAWQFISQNNVNDWIEACNLTNGFRSDGVNVIRMIQHSDLGYSNGFHFGKMFTKLGWAMMSTYSSNNSEWGSNQLIMLKIEANCDVLRCTPTYNLYPDGDAYRNEAPAAMDITGEILVWTGNWGGNFATREVLEGTLPADWETYV